MEVGDKVYVERSSVKSMVYYGEHKREFGCPCKWRKQYGIVTRFHGNYVHVYEVDNPTNITAFHQLDLLVIREEAET
jgi:hypothetical protein